MIATPPPAPSADTERPQARSVGQTRKRVRRPVQAFITVNWSTGEAPAGGPTDAEWSFWAVKTGQGTPLPDGLTSSGSVRFDDDVEAARAAIRKSIEDAGWTIKGDIEDARMWTGMKDDPHFDASCTATHPEWAA